MSNERLPDVVRGEPLDLDAETKLVEAASKALKKRIEVVEKVLSADDDLLFMVNYYDPFEQKSRREVFTSRQEAIKKVEKLRKLGIAPTVDAQPVKKAVTKLATMWRITVTDQKVLENNIKEVIEKGRGLACVVVQTAVWSHTLQRGVTDLGVSMKFYDGGDPDHFAKSLFGTASTRAFKRAVLLLTPYDFASLRDEFGTDEEAETVFGHAEVVYEEAETVADRIAALQAGKTEENEPAEPEKVSEEEKPTEDAIESETEEPLVLDKAISRTALRERDKELKEILKGKDVKPKDLWDEWVKAVGIPKEKAKRVFLTDRAWAMFLNFVKERIGE